MGRGGGRGGALGGAAGGDSRFDKVLTDKRFALGRATTSDASSTSSSSSDSDSSDSELEEEEGVLGRSKEVVPTGEESRRLAVMNCDWDHFSAVDILFVLQVGPYPRTRAAQDVVTVLGVVVVGGGWWVVGGGWC
jgi:hypothetical protein